MLEAKKCKKDPPAPPDGPTSMVECSTSTYGKYRVGSICNFSPASRSDPDRNAGMCDAFYSAINDRRHNTTVKLQWVNDRDPYFTYCWNSGANLFITVPTTIPNGKTLMIIFESKEECTNCIDGGQAFRPTRTIWKTIKYYYSGIMVDKNVMFQPQWENWTYDSYCR